MPMGFMVILGITSLIGIIVSHVIVLFDFIEDRHEQGKPLSEALIDAGILRIRPVLITVGATVAGSVSLGAARWPALGGPLLRANRRINGGHHRDFVYCPNLVLDLCPRFENHSLGGTRTGGGKG